MFAKKLQREWATTKRFKNRKAILAVKLKFVLRWGTLTQVNGGGGISHPFRGVVWGLLLPEDAFRFVPNLTELHLGYLNTRHQGLVHSVRFEHPTPEFDPRG